MAGMQKPGVPTSVWPPSQNHPYVVFHLLVQKFAVSTFLSVELHPIHMHMCL